MKKFIYAGLIFLAGASPGAANMDSGLYDPVPPEGSAFIRFLSEQPAAGSIEARANSKGYDYLKYKDVTSYYVVPQGEVKAQVGDAKTSFNAKAGEFYTVIFNNNNTLSVKTDPQNNNQAKAQIVLYNVTDNKNFTLKTSDGKVEIVPPVTAGEVGERQINPVKVSLALYENDTKVKDLGPVSLERAKSYTVVALDNNEVKWAPASTNTTR
jgi:alginate O-acetyltransferase complex protein AlgF